MTTDHVYFPEPNSVRCVANGDEPLCTLSADQHQPAAAAPVDRSAEAEQSKVPTGFIEVRPGLYERQRPAPNWDQPPDPQAGDEP